MTPDADETSALPGKIDSVPGARTSRPHRGWHERGYLPHFDSDGAVQAIAFRLADSVPRALAEQWRAEAAARGETPDLRRRIDDYQDAGRGACHLRRPEIARIVEDALLHFDGDRYRLLEWCVMPNHVHVLVEQLPGRRLSDVVASWKSFTAKRANRLLGRSGRFWAADYRDRFIRDERHFAAAHRYVRENPVKAGLCAAPSDWPWSSASPRPPDADEASAAPETGASVPRLRWMGERRRVVSSPA